MNIPIILERDIAYHLLVLPAYYELREFLERSMVAPGSYAEEFVKRIYACLYEYSYDVKEDFDRYFSAEYPDFRQFLYWRYQLDDELASRISDLASQGWFVGYGRDTIGIWSGLRFESMLEDLFSRLEGNGNEDQI